MQPDDLRKHVLSIHRSLRIGMAGIAVAFPLILWIGGEIRGIPLQHTVSAYYYAAHNGYTMHDWFVGIMFATGAFLYLYKGFSRREDWVLSLGGVFAVGIAIYPASWNCGHTCELLTTHDTFAILFALCMAYICNFRALDTLYLLGDESLEWKYRVVYRIIGVFMVSSPVLSGLLAMVFQGFRPYTYFAELAGIWAFAAYWIVKSRELGLSNAEHRAVHDLIGPAPLREYSGTVKVGERS